MRILHIINELDDGGAAALLAQWSSWLISKGHEVTVCALYTGGFFAERIRNVGVDVVVLSGRTGSDPLRWHTKYDPTLILRLVRLIRKGEFDVVHAHLFPSNLYTALVSSVVREPRYVASEHSVFNRRRRYRALRPLDRYLYGRFDRIVAVTDEVAEALGAWLPSIAGRIVVVKNCVDVAEATPGPRQMAQLRLELGIREADQVVLFAGRLIPAKGPDLLLDAISLFPAQIDEPRSPVVLLAGRGPMESALRSRVQNDRKLSNVRLIGFREDIGVLLEAADVVVLPSRWEGLPMLLLEAMGAAKPVIAAAVGGIPSVVKDGMDGLLVEPGEPEALATALARLLIDQRERVRLGEAARRKIIEQYSLDAVLPELLETYRRSTSLESGAR